MGVKQLLLLAKTLLNREFYVPSFRIISLVPLAIFWIPFFYN